MALANVTTYVVTCSSANTAYNVLSGTTAAPTLTDDLNYTAQGATFQMQTNAATGKAGGSDVVSNGGVQFFGPDGAYTLPACTFPYGYHVQDWWVTSSAAGGVIVVQFVRIT